jgi:neutral ceramidase
MDLNRRRFLQTSTLASSATVLASLPVAASDGGLTAGVAKRDITPENGRTFEGYVRPEIYAEGVAIRLFTQALVLDDGERKVALVSSDLLSPVARSTVLEHVRPYGFDENTVLYSSTHTHAASGAGDWTAAQVADAIIEADENREPAVAAWGHTEVESVNQTRSLEAHLANHGQDNTPETASPHQDPEGPDHPRDKTLRLLRVDSSDGDPIAAWTHFSVHPTAFTVHNTTYSGDLSGAAVRRFEARFDGKDLDAPLAMFTNGNEGDLISFYDEYNQNALADRLGARLAASMEEAWEDAESRMTDAFPVDGRSKTKTYQGQEVGDGKRVATQGWWGAPTFGGGKNGPSIFYEAGLKGKRRPEELADPIHGRKILTNPAPYSNDVEIQAVRLGSRLILCVPGEPTTQMGRRARRDAAAKAPGDINDIAVVGLANGFNAYFTTPEEYDQQHYAGGHTVFGKYSSLLIRETHAELAAECQDRSAPVAPEGSRPSSPDSPVGDESANGELTESPAGEVERMDVITVRWTGGEDGVDRPVGEPFLVLERKEGDGWSTAATDLGLGFVWTEDDGEYTARYDIPPNLETGTYRLRVNAAGYELTTHFFRIEISSGLRLRGAEMMESGGSAPQLVFRAQNPPPDPEQHLRIRLKEPRGGEVQFSDDGTERTARWDSDVGGWVATVGGISEGDTVTVANGGLVDEFGNQSSAETEFEVGEVTNIEWPPNMETGGGRPPGPFGIGRWPP